MCKKNILLCLFIILVLAFIPLGCDEEEATDGGPTISTKVAYVYVPVKAEIGNNDLYTGLIALEQNIPPLDYKPLPNARVSIGNARGKTNEDGSFSISGVQPGEHQMLITASGYQPVVQLTAVSATKDSTVAVDTMKVIPQEAVIMKDSLIQFLAVGREPAGKFVPLPSVNWTVLLEDKKEVNATISNTGVFKATKAGTYKVVAASGTYNVTNEVIIIDPASPDTSTLTGEVSLPSGSIVEDATVLIGGTDLMGKTNEKGDYSLLSVPAGLSLTIFVIKNDTIIGSAPVTMEKWKEKSVDIMASSDPMAVEDDVEEAVNAAPSTQEGSGEISGYIMAPVPVEGEEVDLISSAGLTLIQSEANPKNLKGIPGATVTLETNPDVSTTTASDGSFTLNNVFYNEDGLSHFIIVSHEDYIPKRFSALFSGDFPVGVVRSLEIWPYVSVVFLDETMEFKAVFFDRKNQIVESSIVDWTIEGDIGEIGPENGFFVPSRVGSGTVVAVYGDIVERKNFSIIGPESTGTLSGTITDEEGNPVYGAFVIPENTSNVGITDETGFYNIPYVPTGEKVSLTVIVKGYISGDAIAAIPIGETHTEDISIKIPVEAIDTAVGDSETIPDMPPNSINPESPANSENLGEVPENVDSEQADEEDLENDNSREEFPRWPEGDKGQEAKVDDGNTTKPEPEEFPRFPAPTPGNK